MNTSSLILAAVVLSTLSIGGRPRQDPTHGVELIRERTTDCCESESVFLTNRLDSRAMVATVAIDRPSSLPSQNPPDLSPALAEVLVGAGETVWVATCCPVADCAHTPKVLDVRLVAARVQGSES